MTAAILKIDIKLRYLMMVQYIGRPPSWTFKMKFLTDGALETFCIIMPYFVEVGCTAAEI